MDTRVHELQQQIALLEDELRLAIRDREAKARFTIRGKRVEFAREVRELHQRVKRDVYHWLVTVLGAHEHYVRFLEFGDSADFHGRLEAFRIGSAHPTAARRRTSPSRCDPRI